MQTYVENQPVISRWMAAVPLAIMITLFLLVVMEKLVTIDMEAPEEDAGLPMPELVYVPEIIETFPEVRIVEKPVIENPPAVPEPSEIDPGDNPVTIPKVQVTPKLREGGVRLNLNGMPVAQYLTTPKYPSRAIQRGIEGYVDVRFDISEIGVTYNISVTRANPEGVFEKSALAAVKRWRYQPKMEDGVGQPYEGMIHRIVFNMED